MNLSEHFTLEELVASDTAARKGIDNTPSGRQVQKLTYLASRLEEVRALVGPLHVNSGYRSFNLNRAIGSKDTSQHVACEAADLSSAQYSALQLCQAVVDSGIQFDQLIYEFESWMHISFAQGRAPRGSVLTIDKQGVRTGLG